MLKKLKEERRYREILLAAREKELRERTTEFDILEKKQKENRLLGIFQPSTEALLKEEEKLKRDLHKREADILQQEAELTIRKEKEQSLQQKQRDSEYETILKLRKERMERETLLKAREEEVRKHKADIDSYETEQSIKLEKERIGLLAFVEEQKERERMLDAFENALIRKQKHLSERDISVKTEQVDYMLLLEEWNRKE